MRPTPLALASAALLLFLVSGAPASAAPILVVDGSRAAPAEDPYLPAGDDLPASTTPATAAARATARAAAKPPRKPERSFKSELARYAGKGSLAPAAADRGRRAYDSALRAARRLSGQRARELRAVLATVDRIVAVGDLSPTRVPALTLILERNRQLWSKRASLPPARGRVEFSGSEIVWEYYPGQGLQIQPLGTFGKANGLWEAGDQDARLRGLFEEMVPLAARRSRALAWEYYFSFSGGRPPWVSGMAQATGLQALSRAITRLGEDRWRPIVPQALTLFELAAPTGVRLPTASGAHYLQYSFAPGERIINAFLQSVNGLYEVASQLGDGRARSLAEQGDAQARSELSQYDTGAWSLYDLGGYEAPLDYFQLARGFLERLCERLGAQVYCDAYTRWGDYLRTPPDPRLLTTSAVAKRTTQLRFALDKISTVGVAVEDPSGATVLETQGQFARGNRYVTFTPRSAGTYVVRIGARDLAGNRKATEWTLEVAPPAAASRR